MTLFSQQKISLISYIIMIAGLLLLFPLGLLPSLLAGLLVYELVNMLTPQLERLVSSRGARWMVVVFLGSLVVSVLALLFASAISFVVHEVENPGALVNNLVSVLNQSRNQMPSFLDSYIPSNTGEFRVAIGIWINKHINDLQLIGKDAVHMFVTLLVGMVLGAVVALQRTISTNQSKVLSIALAMRLTMLLDAFRKIVFAQIKISILNTALTSIFLLFILPLFDVNLPLAKTLIALTFLLGLLPVIGNLISNSLITVIGLSISVWVALGALIYLIIIHKVEYFMNAKIVSEQIYSKSWELLLAMLVFEGFFGLQGVAAASIYYAYLKSELRYLNLV